MGYFGTQDPLPELTPLKAGTLTCFYERGNIRYIKAGEEELIRLIYTALRDDFWNTIPFSITNEKIDRTEDSFHITYTAHYQQKHIAYRADIELVGTSSGEISFAMRGVSQSEFLRNRVGICVLHPIESTTGLSAEVTQPDGNRYSDTFPKLVEPHQPFLEISKFRWQTRQGVEAQLTFEGEIFEMEDQRNWTDHSFKTYGTPLRLPMPVEVRVGDTLFQKVRLRLLSLPNSALERGASEEVLIEADGTAPFPDLGYGYSREPLSDTVIELLGRVPFTHLRVGLDLSSSDWEATFTQALVQAGRLNTRLALALHFGKHPWQEVVDLVGVFTGKTDLIHSLLLINAPQVVSSDGFLRVPTVLRKYLPGVSIGYATDSFFAELNRHRPDPSLYDFLAFPVTPQAHATDLRTIVENAAGQPYAIQTLRAFAGDTVSIHISPLTFRVRGLERSHDPRLHSELAAAFTLLSFRYLAGAEQITLYQTHGPDGLFPAQAPSPLYKYLSIIGDFAPTRILLTHSPDPLRWDALVLANADDEKLYFLINFTTDPLTIRIAGVDQFLTLPAERITVHYGKIRAEVEEEFSG